MPAISSLCRTCMANLNKDENVYSCNIFDTEGLAKRLMLCSNIEIQPNDEYPPHVCNECCIKILDFYDFQELCRQSLQKFDKMLQNQTQADICLPDILGDNTSVEVPNDHLINTKDDESKDDFFNQEEILGDHSIDEPECIQDDIIDVKTGYDSLNDPLSGTKDCVIEEAISIAKREAMEKGINSDHDYSQFSEAAVIRSIIGGDSKSEDSGEVIENDDDEGLVYNNILKMICSVEEAPLYFTSMSPELSVKMSENVSVDIDNKIKDGSSKTEIKFDSNGKDINEEVHFFENLDVDFGIACPSEDEEIYSNSDTVTFDRKSKTGKEFSCDQCPQTFVYEQRLSSHKQIHNGVIEYPCPRENCTRAYNRLLELRQHLNDHDGIPRQIYKCDLNNCGIEFSHKTGLKLHLQHRHKIGPALHDRKYVCETCGTAFTYARSLRVHKYIHVDESLWPFKCDIEGCSKKFRTESSYKIHYNRHYGIKPYACTYCDMRFCSYTNLQAHLNFHTLEKKWLCSFCPKVCYTPASLRLHIRAKHDDNPGAKFSCSFCNKKLSSQLSKKYHEMKHTGERAFVCEECGQGFIQACSLKKHKQIHKPAEEPVKKFHCSVCNRAMSTALVLKYHEMTHTGEKPFKCDKCGVKFRYVSNLQRHQKQKLCRKPKTTKEKGTEVIDCTEISLIDAVQNN